MQDELKETRAYRMVETTHFVAQHQNHGLVEEDLKGAHEVVLSLLKGAKNYALFPEHHSTSEKFLNTIKSNLDSYFKDFDASLRLHVERGKLLFDGREILQGSKEGLEDFATQLYREGVQWIEFDAGIELHEISLFLKILHKYKTVPSEDAEDDLVTALWSAELPHIKYEAADIFWEGEPLLDFSRLNASYSAPEEIKWEGTEKGKYLGSNGGGNIFKPGAGDGQQDKEPTQQLKIDPVAFRKSAEDLNTLKQMIEAEEDRDANQDVLSVLMIVLQTEDNRHNFLASLEFFKEEFRNVLADKKFQFALLLLKNLYALYRNNKSVKPWALPLLENFFKELASAEVLSALLSVWPTLAIIDKNQVKALAKLLVSLPAQAIMTLGPMVPEIEAKQTQALLLTIITYLARKDIRPLKELLDHPDTDFLRQLVNVLGQINTQSSSALLVKKMLHHPADRVRLDALKILVARNSREYVAFLPLINDPNEKVRHRAANYLGKKKNEHVEKLLLNYIKQEQKGEENEENLSRSYKTLGKCGSDNSLPFLRSVLLNSPWNCFYGFGASKHRNGAALALASMETKDSMAALMRASKSFFPHIRRAYRKAAGG